MKTALCAIAKNEELYLMNWINYHLNIGFDTIILGDNNDFANDKQKDLVKDLVAQGKVIYCDLRGRCAMQLRFYEQTYRTYCGQYDWMAFFDVDEFVKLEDDNDIKTFLSNQCFAKSTAIYLNWKCFGDNDLLDYDERPVQERFTKPYMIDTKDPNYDDVLINSHIKSIVKCCSKFIGLANPHNLVHMDCKNYVTNALGERIDEASPWQNIIWHKAWINHYVTMTIHEFFNRRLYRGFADQTVKPNVQSLINQFFAFNDNTEEKMAYLNELFKGSVFVER